MTLKSSIGNFYRRWSPWVLRDRIWREQYDAPTYTTQGLQSYVFLQATLDGEPEPWKKAARYQVKDGIMYYDGTDK